MGDTRARAIQESSFDDLRRRAIQQEQYGNYWALKTRLLIDELRQVTDAEAIIRSLVEFGNSSDPPGIYDEVWCAFCGEASWKINEESHKPDCIYRRAAEWNAGRDLDGPR